MDLGPVDPVDPCHGPCDLSLFSAKELLPAILWTMPLLIIALSDNVLKPLLMGKGSTVPMLVIFLGAIGGFVFSGFIGLFTGAIVLSVGYNLMVHWIGEGQSCAAKSNIP